MQEYLDQNEKIYRHLKLRKLSHGEIYISSIVASKSIHLEKERLNFLAESITQFNGNIPPLVVREIQRDDDDFYEIIYGFEIYEAAKAIDAEKLWAWVINVDDSQVQIVANKVIELFDSSDASFKEDIKKRLISIKEVDQKMINLQNKRISLIDSLLGFIDPTPKVLRINQANLDELIVVPGIGDGYANRIIQNVQYTSLDDITKKVGKGIKDKLENYFDDIFFD